METKQENKLTLTEQALYCAQLMQWAVLSSDKNLHICVDYVASANKFDIFIYIGGISSPLKPQHVNFYVDELTPSKIKTIQKQIAKTLNDAVVY